MKILSTRETTKEDEGIAAKLGFKLLSYPLLRFEFINPDSSRIESLREKAPEGWVFTSKNGVKGFFRLFEQGLVPVKPKKIYAVGKKTAGELNEIEFEAEVPEVENGSSLAEKIINDGVVRSVAHFCGNLRRPELSEKLHEKDISVNEVVVYKTLEEKPGIHPPKDVKAILFYSPSAVEAFRSEFSQYNGIPFVAIGSTTAEALYHLQVKTVIIASEASTESMLKTVKKFLKP